MIGVLVNNHTFGLLAAVIGLEYVWHDILCSTLVKGKTCISCFLLCLYYVLVDDIVIGSLRWYLQVARILMKTVSQLASGKQPVGTMAYMGNVQYLMQCKCAVNTGTYLGWLIIYLVYVPSLFEDNACIDDRNKLIIHV